jgi:hypothetical protein
MTAPRPPATIHCPYCLSEISFNPEHVEEPGQSGTVDLAGMNDLQRTAAMASAVQVCFGGLPRHTVPVPYLTHGPPLTVALVGRSGTGKTNLLGAMLTELAKGALAPMGIRTRAVNQRLHADARENLLEPLGAGEILPGTVVGQPVRFLDALLVSGPNGTRPVGFFDLAGEDLTQSDHTLRFLTGIGALIFVIDPVHALRLPQLAREPGQLDARARAVGDPTFTAVLERLPPRGGALIDVPAAVVVAKSDLMRFDPPVDRWLSRPLRLPLDPDEIERESRDAYAFVERHGGASWLLPVAETRRCTLHFASATGESARTGRYPVGAQGRRAIQPLLALFAMCGLLDPQHGAAVGA